MIDYLEGKITFKSPTVIYMNVNGIGYEVQISLNTFEKIEPLDTCSLHTYLLVKEDALTLYGFYDPEEKEIFLSLISVSGVGAATARMILSGMKPQEVQNAIIEENVTALKSVKGIGVKTAKRMILELKDKLLKSGINPLPSQGIQDSSPGNLKADAFNALMSLGISRNMADKAIKRALKDEENITGVEDLIKKALKNL